MLALVLAIVFSIISITLFTLVYFQRRHVGIPAGKVIYVDTSAWGKVERSLFDPVLGLTGRPDYLVKQGSQVIPVEVKSRSSPEAPYDSHIYQVAAYCLLVEHEFGKRPPHGIIHYADRTFAVDFTMELERSILAIIHEMQQLTSRSSVNRSHQDGRRCQHCGYRSLCDQALRI